MTPEFVEKMRQKLVRVRHELLKEYAGAALDHRGYDAQSFPDVGDEASVTREKTILERLGENERAQIVEIDDALERQQNGDYGRCVDCEEPIPEKRLEAYPAASRCIQCQSSYEREHARARARAAE